MSKCDLSIELERQPSAYFPNEEIRGRVVVFPKETCECADLKVAMQWRTHGRGNRDKGPEIAQSLGACSWTQGMSETYPFAFKMPPGPVTYHGYLINVDWYVSAKADISWALDPSVEQDVVLQPSPVSVREPEGYRQSADRVIPTHSLGRPPAKRNQGMWVLVLFPVFFVLAFGWSGNHIGMWMGLVMFGVFLLIGFGRKGLNLLAKQRLGDVKLTVGPETLVGGSDVSVALSFVSSSNGVINRIMAEVVGEEVAVSGSGSNKTTHRHVLGRWGNELSSRVQLQRGEAVSYAGTIAIPSGVAPTFRGGDNRVEWRVEVHVDIEGWPDLKESVEIEVQPTPSV